MLRCKMGKKRGRPWSVSRTPIEKRLPTPPMKPGLSRLFIRRMGSSSYPGCRERVGSRAHSTDYDDTHSFLPGSRPQGSAGLSPIHPYRTRRLILSLKGSFRSFSQAVTAAVASLSGARQRVPSRNMAQAQTNSRRATAITATFRRALQPRQTWSNTLRKCAL